MMTPLRRYFFAGLFFWLPIWVTLLVIHFLVGLLDNTLALLPNQYQPEYFLGVKIPGFGIILSLLIVIVTGIIVTNFLGKKIVALGEAIVARIPLVRTIYMGTKQVVDTVMHNNHSFSKVLLVEYPRTGMWSLAFMTSLASKEINQKTALEQVCVFIPTTPNPTSGFLLMIPKANVIELEMGIDQALKFIISLGVIQES
jgi:uncharacterized membrane protein